MTILEQLSTAHIGVMSRHTVVTAACHVAGVLQGILATPVSMEEAVLKTDVSVTIYSSFTH